MYENRREIMQDVFLTYLPARKFKTSRLTVNLITGLERAGASANALLPAVLRRGTVRCPDMESLSAAMDTLYGATVDSVVRKKGERQCIGFAADFIDDAFTPHGERLLEPVAELLGELVCDPVTFHGRFVPEYFDSEKTNLLEAIRSLINDKRDWADSRLLRALCAGEAYAIPRLGDEETVDRLQALKVYDQYRQMISTAPMEIIYSGSADLERVRLALAAAFATLPREEVRAISAAEPHIGRETVQYVEDAMDVTQGKLGMGFSCGSSDMPALLMGNTLFGGSSNSKLFLNVREKLSLCYYASSSYARSKNIMTVSSGVEQKDYDRAMEEIARQLGFNKLDTGAMYRAVTFAALDRGIDLDDEAAIDALAEQIEIRFTNGTGEDTRLTIDGVDASAAIRTPQVDANVSKVSAYPGVRAAMLIHQRRAAEDRDIVAEGRDIGTVVFPNAQVKVFLTADPRERARRRVLQRHQNDAQPLTADQLEAEVDETLDALKQRDKLDSSREVAPLVPAEDAVHVDSTAHTIDEVVSIIEDLINQRR